MERARAVAILEGLIAVLIWGASFIATKIALSDASPVTVVWVRFAMGVAVLTVAAAVRRQFASVSPRELATFALLGLIGITFHQWLQSNALGDLPGQHQRLDRGHHPDLHGGPRQTGARGKALLAARRG